MKSSEAMLAPDLLDRLAERIEAETGLSFPASKRRDLKIALRSMAAAMDFEHDEACIDWLLSGCWDQQKTALCARHLTIGETYFFREPRAFDLVCDYARTKLKDPGFANRQLRIWSAGCCTGEEPYSIAIALKHGVPELEPGRIAILGTDLDSRNLQVARAGVYRQWSFRNAWAAFRKLNFSEDCDGGFRISDQIREMVRFAELNLAAPAYPSGASGTQTMDIIFCRNVLMYFSRDQARKAIARFRQCLVPGGWLIVSPSEASAELFSGFSAVYYPDAIYFRKTDDADLKPAQHSFAGLVPAATGTDDIGPQTLPADAVSRGTERAAVPRPHAKREPAQAARRSASRPADGAAAGLEPALHAHRLASGGKIAEAMQFLDRTISAGPPSAELYHAKALIAMEAGNRPEAIGSLKRLLYLQPGFILAHYLMGVLQSAQGRPRDAARQFETAVELLAALGADEIVPGSDGLPAACLLESARSYLHRSGS